MLFFFQSFSVRGGVTHAPQLEKLRLSCTARCLFSDSFTLNITFIFHMPMPHANFMRHFTRTGKEFSCYRQASMSFLEPQHPQLPAPLVFALRGYIIIRLWLTDLSNIWWVNYILNSARYQYWISKDNRFGICKTLCNKKTHTDISK